MAPLASNQLTSRAFLDVPDERSATRKQSTLTVCRRSVVVVATWLNSSLILCGAGAALGVMSAQPMVAVLGRYASRFSVRALDFRSIRACFGSERRWPSSLR